MFDVRKEFRSINWCPLYTKNGLQNNNNNNKSGVFEQTRTKTLSIHQNSKPILPILSLIVIANHVLSFVVNQFAVCYDLKSVIECWM